MVLQKQDLDFCSRPPTAAYRKLSYDGLDIVFSPYSDYFREAKKISVVHLLNSMKVRSLAPIQIEDISIMLINKICSLASSSSVVNLSNLLTNFACTHICKTAFGRSYGDDEESLTKYRTLLNEMQEVFVDLAYSDYFPYFGWLDKLIGKSARLERIFRDMDMFFEKIIKDHLFPTDHRNYNKQEDLVDVLLQLRKQRSFTFDLSLDHVKAILMNVFVAGTETSSDMVMWAMTELIKNPGAMKKVQDELRNNTLKSDCIAEDDLINKEYFKAVIKETFRLHPASPLLIAHQAIRKSKIEGYDIHPGTIVYVNAWAIGRDPASWGSDLDPDKFMPERFLGSSIDFKGQDLVNSFWCW